MRRLANEFLFRNPILATTEDQMAFRITHSMITRRDKILIIRINITVFYTGIDLSNLAMQMKSTDLIPVVYLVKNLSSLSACQQNLLEIYQNTCKPKSSEQNVVWQSYWENKNEVSYRISRVSIRDRPCKHFPHIWFDHHAKFGCFSNCVRTCSSPKSWRTL